MVPMPTKELAIGGKSLTAIYETWELPWIFFNLWRRTGGHHHQPPGPAAYGKSRSSELGSKAETEQNISVSQFTFYHKFSLSGRSEDADA